MIASQVFSARFDYGCEGTWAPALASSRSDAGTTGGAAALARTSITATAPPLTKSAVIIPGRMVGAHIHWGVKGGLVVLSLYMVDSVGPDDENRHNDFAACGGFSMKLSELADSSLADIEMLFSVPRAATCRPTQVEKHPSSITSSPGGTSQV
eukprot:2589370-Pyramimonas_sp.AAC.1